MTRQDKARGDKRHAPLQDADKRYGALGKDTFAPRFLVLFRSLLGLFLGLSARVIHKQDRVVQGTQTHIQTHTYMHAYMMLTQAHQK